MRPQNEIRPDGSLNIERRGLKPALLRDLYHFLLSVRWALFLLILIGGYLSLNVAFALLYLLDPQGLSGVRGDPVVSAFFFAVETFSTVGYGSMAPQTVYTHMIMVLQSLTGFMYTALSTGLIFAKFSRVRARVLFSEKALIHLDDGEPVLTLRAANQRSSQIVNATMKLYLARDEFTQEGVFIRRIYDLKLRRDTTPLFALAWNIYHPIDADSPLYGENAEALQDQRVALFVTFSGTDDSLAQVLHDRWAYPSENIVFDYRFHDMIGKKADGSRYVEYQYFQELVPVQGEHCVDWESTSSNSPELSGGGLPDA